MNIDPPKPTGRFLAELPEMLSTNVPAIEFLNIATSFNFKQYACRQTHNSGHSMVVVFILCGKISSVELLDMTVSDHKCIFYNCDQSLSPVSNTV